MPRGAGLLAVALLLAAGACADAADPPRRGGTVVIGAGSDLDFANPLVTADRWTNEILSYVLMTPLIRYGPGLEYEPYLAESWEMLGDTGVVFQLRRGVRWHDGAPTTAEDVLFTFERAKDPETGFPNAGYFAAWTGGEVVDSYTVRFAFEPHAEPLAGWPFTPIAPKHLLDTVPAALMRQSPFNHRPVGNGPFRFVSQRSNDRWVFEANPDFPEALGGPPLIDRLVWRVIPENTAQIAELRAGEADLVLQPRPQQAVELAARDEFELAVQPSRQFSFIAWNGLREDLADPRVRRALAMAIDRQAIVDRFRGGYGQVATGPIMPFHWSHDPELEPLPHAPDSALALLAAAGIRDRDGDGVLEGRGGEPFGIEIKHAAGSDYNRDIAEAVRGDLAAIGVDASTRPTEITTLFADVTSPERRFDAALLGWAGDFRLSLNDLFHSEAADGPYQFASYRNPAVDSLIDRAAAETDRAAAIPLWREVQRRLMLDQPWTVIFYQTDALVMRERLQGVEMDIRGTLLTVADWWVSGAAPADSALSR